MHDRPSDPAAPDRAGAEVSSLMNHDDDRRRNPGSSRARTMRPRTGASAAIDAGIVAPDLVGIYDPAALVDAGQSHMAKNSEYPNESSRYVRYSIPLRSRSDSVAGPASKSYAIALSG
jgi:hypothetical protein